LLYGASEGRNGISEDLRSGAPTTRHCDAPWTTPSVDADGALHVCAHRPPVENLFAAAGLAGAASPSCAAAY